MGASSAAMIEGGFDDPVHDAQRVFTAVMNALSRPGRVESVRNFASPPAPLNAVAGALCCTLFDADTPIWLSPGLRTDTIAGWLSFQCGALPCEDLGQAAFGLVDDVTAMPALERFAQGSQEYPDRSTTVILQVDRLEGGEKLWLRGPGIKDAAWIAPSPMPPHFLAQWRLNRDLFPRGVDLVLATGDAICCLPRSVEIRAEEQGEA